MVLLTVLLNGCVLDLFPGGRLTIPQETTDELLIRGASIGLLWQEGDSLPDDVGVRLHSERPEYIDAGGLQIFFSFNEFEQQNTEPRRFFYAFSQQVGDDFELLTNPMFGIAGEPLERIYNDLLFNQSLLESESLAGTSDLFLDANSFFMPINATHVELSYASSEHTDQIIIERWALDIFYGYNRYLKPFIDTNQ